MWYGGVFSLNISVFGGRARICDIHTTHQRIWHFTVRSPKDCSSLDWKFLLGNYSVFSNSFHPEVKRIYKKGRSEVSVLFNHPPTHNYFNNHSFSSFFFSPLLVSLSLSLYIYIYIIIHHHVVPPARISLTLSRHFSL